MWELQHAGMSFMKKLRGCGGGESHSHLHSIDSVLSRTCTSSSFLAIIAINHCVFPDALIVLKLVRTLCFRSATFRYIYQLYWCPHKSWYKTWNEQTQYVCGGYLFPRGRSFSFPRCGEGSRHVTRISIRYPSSRLWWERAVLLKHAGHWALQILNKRLR